MINPSHQSSQQPEFDLGLINLSNWSLPISSFLESHLMTDEIFWRDAKEWEVVHEHPLKGLENSFLKEVLQLGHRRKKWSMPKVKGWSMPTAVRNAVSYSPPLWTCCAASFPFPHWPQVDGAGLELMSTQLNANTSHLKRSRSLKKASQNLDLQQAKRKPNDPPDLCC